MAEKKVYEFRQVGIAGGTTPLLNAIALPSRNWSAVSLLSTLPCGTGRSQRIGKSITLRNLYLRIRVVPQQATDMGPVEIGGSGTLCRILVLRDKDVQSAQTTIQNFETFFSTEPGFAYSNVLGTTLPVFQTKNVDTLQRFDVLANIVHTMTPTAIASATAPMTGTSTGEGVYDIRIPVNGMKVQYNNDTNPGTFNVTSETNMVSNDIYIGFASNSSDCCFAQFAANVSFIDM